MSNESKKEENNESIETNDNKSNVFGHEAKQLTEEEVNKLLNDTSIVSQFRQNKLELEAKKNWDLFYKRNSNKFFRDRHWTKREFEELIDGNNGSKGETLFGL
jgi:methyltransferase-like protein 6